MFSFSGVATGPVLQYAHYVEYLELNPTSFNPAAWKALKSRSVHAHAHAHANARVALIEVLPCTHLTDATPHQLYKPTLSNPIGIHPYSTAAKYSNAPPVCVDPTHLCNHLYESYMRVVRRKLTDAFCAMLL